MTMRTTALVATFLLPLHLASTPAEVSTGAFELAYTTTQLVGERSARSVSEVVAPDEEIRFSLYVPPTYDAGKPPGILVYISPTQSGDVPDSWKPVLDAHNLIWIGAHKSGNRELVSRRVLYSILAPTVVNQHYVSDAERVYVSGLSGGGKVASRVATTQPGLFRGAMYNCGVDPLDVDDDALLDKVRQNRFVFVTGEYDQARRPTRKVHRAYGKRGIANTLLLDIPDMSHRNPDSFHFRAAIEFLDGKTDQEI